MKRKIAPFLLSLGLILPAGGLARAADKAAPKECVVLLHGLGRSGSSFLVMGEVLESYGFLVVNQGYPSTEATIDQLFDHVATAVDACGAARVNFVTHSMGGLLARGWLAAHRPENMGRVVMLAPPNQGSEVVDTFRDMKVFEHFTGPAGQQMRTGPEGIGALLGPVTFDLGVIAGNRSVNPLFSAIIPGEDDGTVSVESTRVEGMADHIVIPSTHTFLMNSPVAIAQVITFLETGKFDHALTTMPDAVRRITGH